jgi:hypothetical protein
MKSGNMPGSSAWTPCSHALDLIQAHTKTLRLLPEDDKLIRLLLELALDEAQQVLLVHARAVVDVRVNLCSGTAQHSTAQHSTAQRENQHSTPQQHRQHTRHIVPAFFCWRSC